MKLAEKVSENLYRWWKKANLTNAFFGDFSKTSQSIEIVLVAKDDVFDYNF